MKWLIYKTLVLLSCLAFPAIAQEREPGEAPLQEITSALERYIRLRPQEKLYLHFDKPYYGAGDLVWFRAYLVNAADHAPSALSRIVYAELIGPADTVLQQLTLLKDRGNFNGSFQLPDELPSGNYRVRAYTSWMRNFDQDFFFEKPLKIGNSRLTELQTHIEYETDPGQETPGINARIRFSDRDGQPVSGEEVQYEYVRIGKSGTKGEAVTDEKGEITVTIPYQQSSLYPNQYLRTQIRFDDLPFVQDFFLPVFSEAISLQFFPEGGNLIAGLPNVIAFKAVDASGWSKDVEGYIMDGEGQRVAEFKSRHRGMGKLVLHPEAGQRYTAVLDMPGGQEKEYKFPEVREEGYLFSLSRDDSAVVARVAASSPNLRGRPVHLLVHTRGNPVYAAEGVLDETLYTARIPLSRFPDGIAHFSLFDMYGAPVAERLYFINRGTQLQMELHSGQESYGSREKVSIDIVARDTAGNPVEGEFSISVTDDSVVFRGEGEPGILESLLLTSDLKGYVEDPSFYFQPENPEAEEAADLLMLTQGWRRFKWESVLQEQPEDIVYPAEKALEIQGFVSDDSEKPLPRAQVVMLAGRGKESLVLEDTADAKGHFRFSGYEFPDSTRVVIQARNEKGRRTGNIEIRGEDPPVRFQPERFPPNVNESIAEYLARNRETFVNERGKLGLSGILLDPVRVTAEKAPESTGLHSYADQVITAEDISRMGSPTTIYDVLRGRVPGLMVIGNRVIIRGIGTLYGSTDPLVVIDGVRSMDASILGMINPWDVASIEILKGANAAIYGMGAANGVIVINTKRGETRPRSDFQRRGIVSFEPKGYHVTREFYVPEYEVARNLRDKTPDLRSTIYWNGNIRTDSSGKATVSFYTADRPTRYTAVLEGISAEGAIGHTETSFLIK